MIEDKKQQNTTEEIDNNNLEDKELAVGIEVSDSDIEIEEMLGLLENKE